MVTISTRTRLEISQLAIINPDSTLRYDMPKSHSGKNDDFFDCRNPLHFSNRCNKRLSCYGGDGDNLCKKKLAEKPV